MDFLVNDLSLEEQYHSIKSFQSAISRLMKMKNMVKQYGFEVFCHRNLASAQINQDQTLLQAIQHLNKNEKRSIVSWLTRNGPFWDDDRLHGPDDYLTCKGQVVTDSAVGETAWCCMNAIERHLVSFSPSQWETSPLLVEFFENNLSTKEININNFWDSEKLKSFCDDAPISLDSWEQVYEISKSRFQNLFIAEEAFESLEGYPFIPGAAKRILALLQILERFKSCHDDQGQRTKEGHELYQDFFTGRKGEGGKGALFKDSSDTEKSDFEKEMTFKHPERPGKTLFCPWHGAIQTPQFRIHFPWPVKTDERLYIVYVGPKITKR